MDASSTRSIRFFAIGAHAACGHRYGGHPYDWHLDGVVDELHKYGYDVGQYDAVAYLHDVIEDTQVTEGDLLRRGVPKDVVRAVLFVTDEPGDNRKVRKALTYARVRRQKKRNSPAIRLGLVVKWADRLSNIRASHKSGDNMLWLYRKEAAEFREVYMPCERHPLANDPKFLAMVADYDKLVT